MSGSQQFSPVLVYDDAPAAIDLLTNAFGFTEHAVHRSPDGRIAHAELEYEGAFIGLFDRGPCAIYSVVTDPDAHHDRAIAAGAEVVYPFTDQEYGSRDDTVRDPEGFVWCFGTDAPVSHPGTS